MRTPPRHLSPTTVLLLATALTVLLATPSCGSSTKTADPPSTDPTVETTDNQSDAAAAAEAAYTEFWHVWTRANDPPDSNFPELTNVATAGQLDLLRSSIRDNQSKGVRFEEPDPSKRTHSFTVVSADDAHVVIEDCTIDDGISRDVATGAIVDDSVATYLFKATLVNEAGLWKLADNERLGKWPGITNCGQS